MKKKNKLIKKKKAAVTKHSKVYEQLHVLCIESLGRELSQESTEQPMDAGASLQPLRWPLLPPSLWEAGYPQENCTFGFLTSTYKDHLFKESAWTFMSQPRKTMESQPWIHSARAAEASPLYRAMAALLSTSGSPCCVLSRILVTLGLSQLMAPTVPEDPVLLHSSQGAGLLSSSLLTGQGSVTQSWTLPSV